MSKSPNRKAEERFKQLCLSGIDGNLLLPELLKALQEVVYFHFGAFMTHDFRKRDVLSAQRHYTHSEIPGSEQALLQHADYAHQWFLETFKTPFEEPARGKAERLEECLRISRREFERHDSYQLAWKPILRFGSMRSLTFEQQRGSINTFFAVRPAGDPDFSPRDEQALERLMPFFNHATLAKPDYDGPWVESEDKGLILFKPCGGLQHICPMARKLLYYASFTPDIREQADSLRRLLTDLHRTMQAGFSGQTRRVPIWECRNACGRFTFRAFWLGEGEGLIGVTIERQVPMLVRLLERMDSLPLSAREKEISLLLVQGLSYAAIAERLSRSEYTINAHAQNIFNKVGVANRAELANRLLIG